jgi:S-DNA-T family DNA segregation ATPase FtsK/SpoIIIE
MSIIENDEDSVASVEEQPDEEADRLLMDAVRVIQEYDRASASLLQRRLKVGYARAARIIDQLEARGYVGPFDGSNARQVLRREPATAAAATTWEADGPDDEG